jgi:hypothetical protein
MALSAFDYDALGEVYKLLSNKRFATLFLRFLHNPVYNSVAIRA